MPLSKGDRVRSSAFDQEGVVTRLSGMSMAAVQFPSGERLVRRDSLEQLETDPVEMLAKRDFGHAPEWYDIRLRAARLRAAYGSDNLSGLVNSRVILRPHQVFVAHKILQKARPTMVLADEVGLGKTIEAGLVVKELLARQAVSRILVIVPPNLLNQWQTEMRIKFNEYFEIVDSAGLTRAAQLRPNQNPWSGFQRALISSHFARREDVRDQLAGVSWDLVIVDEAHHARRRLQSGSVNATQLFKTVDQLKDDAFGLLLLTATPMQLHPFEAFSLVELVEPGLFLTYSEFETEVENSTDLNHAVKILQAWDEADQPDRTFAHRIVTARYATARFESRVEREETVDHLVASQRITGAMVRNRKRSVGGFTKRRAKTVSVQIGADERAAYEALGDYLKLGFRAVRENKQQQALGLELTSYQRMATSSSRALVGSLRTRRARLLRNEEASLREMDEDDDLPSRKGAPIQNVKTDVAYLDRLISMFSKLEDSKIAVCRQLVRKLIDERPGEKVLIFTTFYATQDALSEALRGIGDIAIFRGSQNRVEKDRAVNDFRTRCPIMISTEAGGEGRNFQFCRNLINFDLHWNPMRIEQRIGRLDRYGQTRNVHIYNLATAGTIEDRLLELFTQRLHLFESTVGALELILGEVEEDLRRAFVQAEGNVQDAVEIFDRDIEQKMRDAKLVEEKSADFLIELSSFRKEEADNLTRELEEGRIRVDLELLVTQVLDYFPTSTVKVDDDIYEIDVPPVLENVTSTTLEKRYRGTFSPAAAVADEALDFFGFGHALVDACIQYTQMEGAAGAAGIRLLPDDVLSEPATQFNFEVEFRGVRRWAEVVTVVLDYQGRRRRGVEDELQQASIPDAWYAETAVVPPDLTQLRATAEDEVGALLESRMAELSPLNAHFGDEEARRANRIHLYNLRRIREKEERLVRQIAGLEDAADDAQRRILPALRGQLTSLARDRQHLDQQLTEKLNSVQVKVHLEPTVRLISAGLLVPEPVSP